MKADQEEFNELMKLTDMDWVETSYEDEMA
jgi:hypothetical protein